MAKFKAGDKVKLYDDFSPEMLVENARNPMEDYTACIWFAKDAKLQAHVFHDSQLKIVPELGDIVNQPPMDRPIGMMK